MPLPIIAGLALGAGAGAAIGGATAIGALAGAGIGASIGGGIGATIHGTGQAAEASREAARKSNEATERAWAYNTDLWEMEKDKLDRDHAFRTETIHIQARNELRGAQYKDANLAQQFNRQVQIRNMQQAGAEAEFAKSDEIYQFQTGFNRESAEAAREGEWRKFQETQAGAAFDRQEAFVQHLENEGKIRARGTTGRSTNKVSQATLAKFGTSMAILSESVANAGRNMRAALGDVDREEWAANLTAYASKMLDPGVLPEIPVPFATPLTEWQFPEELQEFDYGPPPVLGAMMSPSAQSQMIWGQGIASIGSQVAGIGASFIPTN
tara:strand:+ start:1221 stop:2195 length:975 start_codon:yes stop_codon:yes gene_type:complete